MFDVSAVNVCSTWAVPLIPGRPVAGLFGSSGVGFSGSASSSGPGSVVCTAEDSVRPSSVQIPPESQGRPVNRLNTMSSVPSGFRKNIQVFSSPFSSWRLTPLTVAPVNDTEGVVFSNDATGRLKATMTWGRSSVPVWRADWYGLMGNVAVSGAGGNTAPVAALVSDSALPSSSVKVTCTVMVAPWSLSVRVYEEPVAPDMPALFRFHW